MIIAKTMGLNGLRIHIKPDEPRRLYWADHFGLLILEDMPNTWRQNARARRAWERTMHEVVARDRNHPAIIAWVAFNETWGLGDPGRYKEDRDTQRWVGAMVDDIRRLDPTRLVEDNSPCHYDHVEDTDLNSWHFYIDDHEAARRHIAQVVAATEPGSGFNYCPGLKQATAPLINSEYGAVSAGGGDRDISWGFRDLTTLLRRQTQDPGVRLHRADRRRVGAQRLRQLRPLAQEVRVRRLRPRHARERAAGGRLHRLRGPAGRRGTSGPGGHHPGLHQPLLGPQGTAPDPLVVQRLGRPRPPAHGRRPPRSRAADWTPYGVRVQEPVTVRLPDRPFVGAVVLTLRDEDNRRIAANFVNVVVQPETPLPRIERHGDREVIVRFAPGELARQAWSGPSASSEGKVAGQGRGFFEYRLRLPDAVVKAQPESYDYLIEASSQAGRGRVDWPRRVNRRDHPQTDARKWPSTLEVAMNGRAVDRVTLPRRPGRRARRPLAPGRLGPRQLWRAGRRRGRVPAAGPGRPRRGPAPGDPAGRARRRPARRRPLHLRCAAGPVPVRPHVHDPYARPPAPGPRRPSLRPLTITPQPRRPGRQAAAPHLTDP